jgi:hypothetical protein
MTVVKKASKIATFLSNIYRRVHRIALSNSISLAQFSTGQTMEVAWLT